MLISAFPNGNADNKRVELCRFTTSGTFNPADHPTADGLYDVYIVGGGGGARGHYSIGGKWQNSDLTAGGGGGYAKLLKNIAITSNVAVTVGAAGTKRIWNNSMNYQQWEEGSDGGGTRFGNYGTANGGKRAADSGTGGDGGCGGAGFGSLIGGLNGHDGQGARYWDGNDSISTGIGGKGGGTSDYTPINPYDGLMYGIGGNSEARIYWMNNDRTSCGDSYQSTYINLPALNDNPGRGGGATADALPGICIVYGTPKY